VTARRLLQDTWTIAAKDARELWRDGRFRWLAAALLAVLGAASVTGWVQTANTARLHLEAQAAERDFALDRGEMNPHAAAHYGAFFFKPVEPLSAIDPGLDPYVGVAVFLEAHQQHNASYRPVADATPARRLGELSLAAALQVLLPLLIVTIASGAISVERERGTLAQILGTGVSKWAFGLGKLAGCAAPPLMVLVPIVVVVVAGAVFTQAPGLDADAAIRAALLVVVYGLSVVLWLGIALTVSALARSSSGALVTLLAIWFVACVVAPRVVATAATLLNPSPTSAAFTLAVQEGRDALPSWTERVAGVEERFLSGELPPDPEMPSNPEVIALVDTERDESDLYDRLFAQLFAAYDRQTRSYERAAWAVPTIAAQTLSMALSGTDYDLHRRFVEATSDYREQFLSLLNDELVAYREVNTFDYTRGRELWERIPEFSFNPPTADDLMRQHRGSGAALVLWSSVALLSFGLAVKRMKIR
jgi:ABC-2 type transport system permease protein